MLLTLLSGVVFYCFFAFKYPYHLHFQEQLQLFESTWDYFRGVAAVPGGLADWLGRFFTQFFYYAPAGAAIIAVLLCAVQLLTWAACRRKSLTVYAMSFIPAATLLAFHCDESALLGGTVAVILSLAGVVLCSLIRKDLIRHVVEVLAVPALYMACGSLAVIFVLITAVNEFSACGRRFLPFAAAMLVLAVLGPVISARLVSYPLKRLFLGVHYYRLHNILPGILWASALACILIAAFACFKAKERPSGRQFVTGLATFVIVAALGTVLTLKAADYNEEEWMRYDFMARMEMWNRIMMSADKNNPDNPTTVSCLNLALAKTGRMGDHMFDYFQNGPEGLLPSFTRSFTVPITTSEIFWHLGMVNTAQRYVFEGQEAIPDFQKSARCYKRLVQTNIVNGDYEVARKYLKALHNAVFYRRWADATLESLDAGDIFEKQPELARAKDLRLKEHDFLFSDTEMDSMLGLLHVENPSNSMALDYLLAWCLLRKDLDRLTEVISLVTAPALPKSCQEALLLKWVLTHNDFNGLPEYISRTHVQRISMFISDIQSGKTEEQMRAKYGDTYWFFYYYRYRTAS
jgi:hypothetical protein